MANINFSVSYVKKTLNKIEELKNTNSNLENELEKETDETKKTGLQNAIELNNRTIADLENELRNEIEEEIGRLNRHADRMSLHLDKVLSSLKLEFNIEETDTRDLLKGISEELGDINREANELRVAIGEFKGLTKQDVFDLPLRDVINKITNIKERVRELKREQIRKYNDRVERIKLAIEEYKVKFADNQEALNLLSKASDGLTKCDANVRDWQAISFLDQINYAKLADAVRVIKEVEEMDKTVEVEPSEPTFGSLDDNLEYVRKKVAELEVILSMTDTMDYVTYLDTTAKLETLKDSLLSFNNELEKNKNQLSAEKYQEYLNTHRDLMLSYMSLSGRFIFKGKEIDLLNYNSLANELKNIKTDVNRFDVEVSALFGKVTDNVKEVFENELKRLNDNLSAFVKKINDLHNDKVIDDNQYQSLNFTINVVGEKLEKTDLKLKEPEMFSVRNIKDIFAFLNGTLDGVEKTIEGLEITLNHLEKPIKDRETRKLLNDNFKKLEAAIKKLEDQLKMYKEDDEEKYNVTKERLDNVKKRMNNLGKTYRRKCPLLVRSVKSAKNFFKKYKKVLLIIAGIASFAMLSHSVIIPAIMYGNAMTAGFLPTLAGPIKTINNLLGGLIGATKSSMGVWTLANGVKLTSYAATSSLLKGLAISGIGSASLVAPVIVAVKRLIEKINMQELKQQLKDGKDKAVAGIKQTGEKIVDGAKKVKAKADKVIDDSRTKTAQKKTKKEMKLEMFELFNDFVKSGKSLEEYCSEYQLTAYQVKMLEMFEENTLENKENMINRKGKK